MTLDSYPYVDRRSKLGDFSSHYPEWGLIKTFWFPYFRLLKPEPRSSLTLRVLVSLATRVLSKTTIFRNSIDGFYGGDGLRTPGVMSPFLSTLFKLFPFFI